MTQVNYNDLRNALLSLTEGEHDEIALMATFVCEVHHSDARFDWTGFYRVTDPEVLKIGPYQGGHGCLIIPFSKGVCGAAARELKTQRIADVEMFEGHIACASSTRSELVIPVSNDAGRLLGVLDIDSDQPDAFTQEDENNLTKLLSEIFAKVV